MANARPKQVKKPAKAREYRFHLRIWLTGLWIGYFSFELILLLLQLVAVESEISIYYFLRLDLVLVLPSILLITAAIEYNIYRTSKKQIKHD